MEKVNVATLKNKLSHYLRVVRNGARIVVTDHGVPVARLVPLQAMGEESPAERMAGLHEAGEVGHYCLEPQFAKAKPLALNGDLASRLIREDRDARL
ncbi:MAG: type II toxin-antitoxin system prevent-host-death family antitoxin [Deltaproteobacteria bacterium]|nr:type II toxin-antitoxin system prevent-host-death family antitoxin [Deltaproteobacteria bacterium]